jgi:hypothetical protein
MIYKFDRIIKTFMKPLKRHRNITLKRIVLDMYQYCRTQRLCTGLLGRPFQRSTKLIEIDITYRCNLRCFNCNRSCTQAPSKAELSPSQVQAFVSQSIANNMHWERIRLLGGEPTLHPDFFHIVDILLQYQSLHNPDVRLVVCSNGHGRKVNAILSKLPSLVEIKTTIKTGNENLFRPFNLAPKDSLAYRFSDFSSGCRIIEDCGIGYTPQGYYICAVAGAIDRIFGFHMGRTTLPEKTDQMIDQCEAFCPLCGHFGFRIPVKKTKMSPIWQKAYAGYHSRKNSYQPLKNRT